MNAHPAIAVIGIGCRFPGSANSPAEFWELLARAGDGIVDIPPERWSVRDSAGMPHRAGLLDDIAGFDAEFFGITVREALSLDPQQRFVLEVAWEAAEDAGIAPPDLRETRTGVFIGATARDYAARLQERRSSVPADAYHGSGNSLNFISGRLSYTLGLRGPALCVDTACSSSLTALHLAVRSLRDGESDFAFAGGVNLILDPEVSRSAHRSNLLSPQGRCNTFDRSANGIVRGEGCGVLLLMRLEDALAQRRAIRAVIRGSAINQDGASSGLMTPRLDAQVDVITAALRDARVSAAEIDYVEAHGTGTSLGDPIELRALGAVFARERAQPLKIGSVKTNLGHLESAAGMAGLIKVVLSMEQESLPAHLRFDTPTPYVDWPSLRLRVVSARESWKGGSNPLRAGVSSFGGSGSNAHVIVEQAPRAAPSSTAAPTGAQLLVLSARTERALRGLRMRWSERLAHCGDGVELAALCAKAAVGRGHFAHRWSGVAHSAGQMHALLSSPETAPAPAAARNVNVAFLFTGQGAQYAGMGRALYATQPAFRAAFDSLAAQFAAEVGLAPDELLWGSSSGLLQDTRYTQPAMFLIQYCLLRQWEDWGIVPDVVLGHSVGEFAAACAAGVMEASEALFLAAARGRLMAQRCEAGGMLVVMAEPRELEAALLREPQLSICAINAPRQTVIGGSHAALARLRDVLESRGLSCHALAVSHAFHSSMMEPMLDELAHVGARISPRAPQLTMISSVTGSAVDEELCDPQYWARHARRPVRFADALRTLASLEPHVLVEVGCGNTLLGLARQNALAASMCTSMQAGRERDCLLEAAATLYRAGATLRWSKMFAEPSRAHTAAPSYCFDKERILVEAAQERQTPTGDALQSCLLQRSWVVPRADGAPPDMPRSMFVFTEDADWNPGTRGVEVCRIDPRGPDFRALGAAIGPEAHCLYIIPGPRGSHLQPPEFARESLSDWARALDWWEQNAPGRPFATLIYIAAESDEPDAPLTWAAAAVRAAALSCAIEGRCCPVSIVEARADQVSVRAQIEAACRSPDVVRAEPCLRWIEGAFRAPRFERATRKITPAATPNGTVLITGGVGALGLALCERLSQLGSGPFILMSRRAEEQLDAGTASRVAALRARGSIVELVSADVGDRAALQQALARIRATHPPLRNIFHAAGIFEADSLATLASGDRLEGFAAKAGGAWLLHELTGGDPIERFVLASSASVNWGTPGHIAYASANACLDELAQFRRARGLPATSIQFGPMSSQGMASGARAAAIDASGMQRLELDVAVEAMIALDIEDASPPIVADADWSRFAAVLATRHRLRWFEPLARGAADARTVDAKLDPAGMQSLRTLHVSVRVQRVRELCRDVVAAVMRKDAAHSLAFDQPIQQWGVDSILALEIREQLSSRLGLPLPASLIFEYPTLQALGQFIHDEWFGTAEPATTAAVAVAPDPATQHEIAIVGIGCRFPGSANDVEQFWSNLLAGVDGIADCPESRFARARGDAAEEVGPVGLIDDIEFFDAAFFGINPREARLMDPQQRIALQTCWHALEHANLSPAGLNGSRTGVFLGVADNDYLALLRRSNALDDDAAYLGTGSKLNVIAGRISYFFGFEGPSLALDTACSSSAVAIHLACQSLRQRECDLALAGGVNAILDPLGFATARRAKMLASDGRCKTFDAAADGYVRAEGCGVLVLKRLHDAIRDGDSVIAVIEGSAVNQDGRSSSLTAPSLQAQIKVIEAAAHSCNADLRLVDYVEAHGTGTPLGDPIELKALARTYGAGRDPGRRVLVGSVKSQIGHTEAAAGAAGVIKLALALERGTLPRTLHYRSLNPEAAVCAPALQVVDRALPWPAHGARRLGAVSSFGFSGTNAHLILASPPSIERAAASPLPVLCISAATSQALQRACARWRVALGRVRDGSWSDLAASSQHGRWHGPERVCIVRSRIEDVLAGLEAASAGADHASISRGRVSDASMGLALGQHCDVAACSTIATALAAELRDIDAIVQRAAVEEAALSALTSWPVLRLEWALLKRLRTLGVGIVRVVSTADHLPLAAWAADVIDERALAILLAGRAGMRSAIPPCSAASCEVLTCDGANLTAALATPEFWREWPIVAPADAAQDDTASQRVSLRTVAASLCRTEPQLPFDACLLAVAHCGGLRVTWPARDHPRARAPLYPFERQRVWCHDGPVLVPGEHPATQARVPAAAGHYLLGTMTRSPRSQQIDFHKRISATAPAYVNDHRLLETMVVPAASHLSMVLSAWRVLGRPYPCCIEDVRLASPMVLQDEDARDLHISLRPRDADSYYAVLRSQQVAGPGRDADWVTHATCVLRALDQARPAAPVSFDEVTRTWDRAVASAEFYEHFRGHGYTLGPSFRWLGAGWSREGATVRQVHVAAPREELEQVELHAGLIDTSFSVRSSGQMEWVRHFDAEHMAIPVAIERLEFYGWQRPHGESWIHAQPGGLTVLEEGRLRENICLCEADRVVARITGFETRRARRDVLRQGANEVNRDWLYRDAWTPVAARVASARGAPVWVLAPAGGTRADAICGALVRAGRAHVRTTAGEFAAQAADIEVWWIDDSAAGVAQPPADPCAAVLGLVRDWPRLVRQLSGSRACVTLITRGAFSARGSDPPPRDTEAALAAFMAGLMVEHEDLRPRVLDLDPASTDAIGESRSVCELLATVAPDESRLALRGDAALALRLERYRPQAAAVPAAADAQRRHIITGGLGGIGSRLASRLLGGGARSIQLLSRRIPDADAWAALQAEALGLGARLELIEADIADPAIVARLADDTREIAGIYHAAGSLDDELVMRMDERRQQRVLQGKWIGCRNLAQLARRCNPRAVWFFSSFAASMPGAGQATYAAANAAIDAIALQLSAAGVNAHSVRFGPWRETGMSARRGETFFDKARASGVSAFGVEQVMRIIERVADDPLAVTTAAIVHWPEFMQARPQWADSPYLEMFRPAAETAPGAGSDLLARLRLALPMARQDVLMSELRETVAHTLGLSDAGLVEPDRRLFDLGMDSIAAMELRDVLAKLLNLKLRSTLLLDHSTLSALSRYLLEQLFPRAEPAAPSQGPRRSLDVDAMSEQEAELALLAELKH